MAFGASNDRDLDSVPTSAVVEEFSPVLLLPIGARSFEARLIECEDPRVGTAACPRSARAADTCRANRWGVSAVPAATSPARACRARHVTQAQIAHVRAAPRHPYQTRLDRPNPTNHRQPSSRNTPLHYSMSVDERWRTGAGTRTCLGRVDGWPGGCGHRLQVSDRADRGRQGRLRRVVTGAGADLLQRHPRAWRVAGTLAGPRAGHAGFGRSGPGQRAGEPDRQGPASALRRCCAPTPSAY